MTSRPPLRLALALGDQELEQRLRPALDADDAIQVTVNCLAADQVVYAVEANAVDVVVVAAGLHRLSEAVLHQLERARTPLVLLAAGADMPASHARRATVLPLDVEPSTLRQAIASVAHGERWVGRPRVSREPNPQSSAPIDQPSPSDLSVLAVAGGAGSPGRTTLAINLATALGAVAPTVLVDLDLTSPSVAAYLNRDPSRNVCTLAHAVRESPRAWGLALEQELQPLHPRSPSGMVLCGLPKRELRTSLTPSVMEQLIGELAGRFRYVVIDAGAELLGVEAAAATHRGALTLAQQVLLVTGSDLVSLWHARTALDQLERQLGIARERIALVINRHDSRYHHPRAEIEWHLGSSAALLIPHDYGALQKAVADQCPVVAYPTSKAAHAILDLAERVHQGRVRLPPSATGHTVRGRWRVALPTSVAGLVRWGGSS
jgi:Flp pilus assembly CpaE family ATPase